MPRQLKTTDREREKEIVAKQMARVKHLELLQEASSTALKQQVQQQVQQV